MNTCPQCGTQNQVGAMFCDNCGASLGSASAPGAGSASGGNLTCPSCGVKVIAGQEFCDECGAAIPRLAPVQQSVPIPAPAEVEVTAGSVTCSVCGELNSVGQSYCDQCGASLAGQDKPSKGRDLTSSAQAHLELAESGIQFALSGKNQVLLGREDPVSGIFPDVDLTPHGGENGGVSRRHAQMTFSGSQWTIEDLGSVNFTFVNNQQLKPGVVQPLKAGDQIRLSRILLTFRT